MTQVAQFTRGRWRYAINPANVDVVCQNPDSLDGCVQIFSGGSDSPVTVDQSYADVLAALGWESAVVDCET